MTNHKNRQPPGLQRILTPANVSTSGFLIDRGWQRLADEHGVLLEAPRSIIPIRLDGAVYRNRFTKGRVFDLFLFSVFFFFLDGENVWQDEVLTR